ncbi:MAG: lytic transglycosylase domain-containing protein [Sedimentitalea sp.]
MVLRASVLAMAGVMVGIAGVGWSETPRPFPKFEAKRIKPPSNGQKRRMIQIDPTEQARLLALPKPKPTKDAGAAPSETSRDSPGKHAWFWDKISPSLTEAGPGRLDGALSALAAAQSVAAPRLQNLQEIAQDQGIPILRATVGTNVSPALVLAVISVESAGRADAVSGAGAQGLMQLMPATAERFGVKDSLEAAANISGGVKYLDWLMGEFGNDPILVLAGYNAGEGSVRTHAGVPPYAETRDYVPKVLAAFQVAKGLCATPPELISDGCVFVRRK